MSAPMDRSELEMISIRFLAGVPLNKWCKECFRFQDIDSQHELIHKTVKHHLALLYPLSRKYRVAFLKLIITELERNCAEVYEEFYEIYTEILGESSDSEYGTKIYLLPENDDYVTIIESSQIVSEGTTGLRTWPAAFYLAEYLLENKSLVSSHSVLELGCGLGFLGLVACRTLKPASYIFTDCHDSVLKHLSANIKTNVERWQSSQCCHLIFESSEINCETSGDDATDIRVELIDWSKDGEMEKIDCFKPAVILATDVVYDTSIIPSLVRTLNHLLTRISSSTAYISSTIRDSKTQETFKHQLECSGLTYSVLSPPTQNTFIYDRNSIEIIKINKSFNN